MDEILRYFFMFLTGGLATWIGVYISLRSMKSTERKDASTVMKDLQDIADRAVKAQVAASEQLTRTAAAFEGQRHNYEQRIEELERQIQLLLEGDLRVEMVIGGNPKTAKHVKIESIVALPSLEVKKNKVTHDALKDKDIPE